jgi:hypothetical protein
MSNKPFIRTTGNAFDHSLDGPPDPYVSSGVARWLRDQAAQTREKAEHADDRSGQWSLLALARAYDGRAEQVEATIAAIATISPTTANIRLFGKFHCEGNPCSPSCAAPTAVAMRSISRTIPSSSTWR